MSKFIMSAAALTAVLTGAVVAAPHHGPHARITMAQARAIALHAAPGKVVSAEFENEGGGWRYSFDIQQKGNIQEIGVDGQSGKIVENKSEGRKDHD